MNTANAHEIAASMSGCYYRCNLRLKTVYDTLSLYTTSTTDYFNHVYQNLSYSYQMGVGSFYFYVHALIPSYFQKKGKKTVYELYDTLNMNKDV